MYLLSSQLFVDIMLTPLHQSIPVLILLIVGIVTVRSTDSISEVVMVSYICQGPAFYVSNLT